MDLLHKKEIDDLKQRVDELNKTIAHQKDLIGKLEPLAMERSVVIDTVNALLKSGTFDQALHQVMGIVSLHVEADYYGIFWLDDSGQFLEYRHGKGYHFKELPRIPADKGLMGKCLNEARTIHEGEIENNADYISLGQSPDERNLICVPLLILNRPVGVFRIANLGNTSAIAAKSILPSLGSIVSLSLERLIFWQEKEKTRRSIEVVHSIAHALERTLDEGKILQQLFEEIPKIVPLRAAIISLLEDGKVRPKLKWPSDFFVNGSERLENIYFIDLNRKFPNGRCLIPDVHDLSDLNISDDSVRSLAMVPIHLRTKTVGTITVIGPREEVYGQNQLDLIDLVAIQTSTTLERAANFRQHEIDIKNDPLTGLLNHRVFQEKLKEEIGRCQRYSRQLSLIMLKIDAFDRFNESYGFDKGDELLKSVANLLKSHVRNADMVFKYSGRDFCIILPETPGENALSSADRIKSKIGTSGSSFNHPPFTMSIGIADLREDDTAQTLINRARQCAKEAGKMEGNSCHLG